MGWVPYGYEYESYGWNFNEIPKSNEHSSSYIHMMNSIYVWTYIYTHVWCIMSCGVTYEGVYIVYMLGGLYIYLRYVYMG